jgi:hypothetical protein
LLHVQVHEKNNYRFNKLRLFEVEEYHFVTLAGYAAMIAMLSI